MNLPIYLYVKIQTPLWPYPTSKDLDLNKVELTLPEIFRLNGFWEDNLSIFISLYSFSWTRSSYCDQTLPPRDHDLNKLKSSSPPEDALTQVSNFLTKWFLRRRFLKNANNILIPKYFPLKEGLVFPFNKLELSIRKCNKKVYTVQTDWQTQGRKKSSWHVKMQTISCYFYVHYSNCLKNIKL